MGDAHAPRPLAEEKAAAFALARRRFAMYGSRHAHVSHVAPAASRPAGSGGLAPLKSSLALQENGALALRLDDLRYRVDGALTATSDAVAAQNVAELARVLLLGPAQLALALAKEQLHARIRDVLALAAPSGSDAPRGLDLAVAVLALALTQSACAEEIFTLDRKRAAASPSRQRASSGSSDDGSKDDDDQQQQQQQLPEPIASLLRGRDAFCVDGALVSVSAADVWAMALQHLLQADRAHLEQQPSCTSQQRGRNDLAGATFAAVRDRKRRLVANGGLEALVQSLAARFRPVERCVLDGRHDAPVHVRTRLLWRLQAVLLVLDHASFLAAPAQQFLARKRALFVVLLECVEHMSALCWGERRSELAGADHAACAHLLADVLLAAVRVLINLTHHNDEAAQQIHNFHGTGVLFRAFCRLWGFIEVAVGDDVGPVFEEKVLFDALLVTLSALTNCVEFSEENRRALSTVATPASVAVGLERFQRSGSSCELLAHFFLARVQSFAHLLDTSESHHRTQHWVPEDVVLGGCASLLLGCLMTNAPENASAILAVLPDRSPRLLLRALSAFVALHSQIGALTPEVGDSVLQVEQTLKSFDRGNSPGFGLSNSPPANPAPLELKISVVSVGGGLQEAVSLSLCASSSNTIDGAARSRAPESGGRTPPAAAFKLLWRSKVCTTVDSDTDDGGEAATPSGVTQKAAPAAQATPSKRSLKKPSARSPVVRRSPGARTPSKVPVSEGSTSAGRGSRTRVVTLKSEEHTLASAPLANRTQQLVTELAAKLAQVSDDDDGDGAPTRVLVVSETPPPRRSSGYGLDDDDEDDDLDFSRDRTTKTTAKPPPPPPPSHRQPPSSSSSSVFDFDA
ncbi:hypothetical protein PybrP1_000914 [[Pythium] brassicae (nom. inval.)]|nr:hypothetical protein PybrP1_000914 [[Pythium] brassicae (nom. inval.)]